MTVLAAIAGHRARGTSTGRRWPSSVSVASASLSAAVSA